MCSLACGDELFEGGLRARNESLAGFRQADAARRAEEERRADAGLECTYRLADGRWGHPELRGCLAETAMLGNAQERLHAVERTLPNCEVPLHSSSTLSRIVARGKRPYIRLANQGHRQGRGPTFATPGYLEEQT